MGRNMVIPPVTTAPTKPSAKRRRDSNRRPRPPVPPEPSKVIELPVSILPPALQALLEALPAGLTLPWELLGPMVLQRTPPGQCDFVPVVVLAQTLRPR